MFTGIVEAVGVIESLERSPDSGRLSVEAAEIAPTLEVGSSIAVNGCCLTVAERSNRVFSADLSGETLRRTAFGEMQLGKRVNLEKPLAAGAPLGGHFVQGHVDGVGRVTALVPEDPEQGRKNWWLSIRVPKELGRYVGLKGSIAIDGISLTVAGWRDSVVDIAIIPLTYKHTNICDLTIGDAVNLECDILAKYVERLLEDPREPASTQLTIDKLIKEGF